MKAFANNAKRRDDGPGTPSRKTVTKKGGVTYTEEEYSSSGGSGSASKKSGRDWSGKKMGMSGKGKGSGTSSGKASSSSPGKGSGQGGTPAGVTKIRRIMVDPIEGKGIAKTSASIRKKEMPSASAGKNKVGKLTPSELARKQVSTGKSAGQIAAEEAKQGKGSTYSAAGKSTNQKKVGIPTSNTSGGYSVQGSVRDKSGKKKQR